jgi:hypothetical protein
MDKVLRAPHNCYSHWRAQGLLPQTMAEKPEEPLLNEHLLQLIWQHQRFQRDALHTTDAQPIKVLHPGFWNRESGPDFQRAIVQIGGEWPKSGDVEIDLSTSGWHNHRHDQNPAYYEVILHVVWEAKGEQPRTLPTLALKSQLDAPLEELALWLGEDPSAIPAPLLGQCCPPLRDLAGEKVSEILREAAHNRLQAKATQFQARARQAGWDQSLMEGLFGALGYKNNVWPMRRLAELAFLSCSSRDPQRRCMNTHLPVLLWQARLLGLGGLLPGELPGLRVAADSYLRSLWDLWWRERDQFAEVILPQRIWHLHGLRPANHPQRRLALASHWLASGDLPARIEDWFRAKISDSKLSSTLLDVLQAKEDSFWARHWSLKSPVMLQPQPLLGPQRATDIAINVILPWLWIRAVLGDNEELRRVAEARYFAWPGAEDNAVLRLARRRLFGRARMDLKITAANQQGVLQIVRDFCQHSNALCEHCQFPELVLCRRGKLLV